MATVCPTFEHVGDQLLDVDKDCNKVVIALTSIHHKWYQLGTHLNIPNGTLQSIAGKHNNDHFIQMSDLISTWIRRPTPDHHPSWRVLCQALAGMGEVGLADKIAGNKNEDQSNGSNNPESVAKELKNSFDELLVFMIKEIRHVDIDLLRLKISRHFQDEEENVDEKIEQYLAKICRDVLYDTPDAILNFFIRSNFIGYINYSLIKVFQKVANSPLLDLHIKKYEEKYYLFLKLTFKDYIQIFQQHRDLRPDYPAGIPQFSFHLESEWNGRTMITLKDVLQHCLPAGSNQGFIHQLMITRIEQNCVIIAFAVLPHIAREVFKYLTNDDVIKSMKKEGISVNISEQLMKYEEFDTTSVELSLENGPTPFGLEVPHTTGILAVKPHWDTFTDTGYGGSSVYSDHRESEVNEDSRLVDLKDDVTLKEAVDTYEKVVNMLRKRIKSYESQFVTHKQMMMELDNTRDVEKVIETKRLALDKTPVEGTDNRFKGIWDLPSRDSKNSCPITLNAGYTPTKGTIKWLPKQSMDCAKGGGDQQHLVVVITNEYKHTDHRLEGIKVDRKQLYKTFDGEMFELFVSEDSRKLEMEVSLLPMIEEDRKQSGKSYKSAIIIFSGHGGISEHNNPFIWSEDREKVNLEKLIHDLEEMIGDAVPKFFLIDACRKVVADDSAKGAGVNTLHAYSTQEGEIAYVNRKKGSYWIQKVVELLRSKNSAFVKIIEKANKEVAKEKTQKPVIKVNTLDDVGKNLHLEIDYESSEEESDDGSVDCDWDKGHENAVTTTDPATIMLTPQIPGTTSTNNGQPQPDSPQQAELLHILSGVTTKLKTFCTNLRLPSEKYNEIFDDPTIKGDFDAQRHKVLDLWSNEKTPTWEDLVKALNQTGYSQKAREVTEKYLK